MNLILLYIDIRKEARAKASEVKAENALVSTTLLSAMFGSPHRFRQVATQAWAWLRNVWRTVQPGGEVFNVERGRAIVQFLQQEHGFTDVELHVAAPGFNAPVGHVDFDKSTGKVRIYLNPYLPFREQIRVLAHELAHIQDPHADASWWARETYAMDTADAEVTAYERRLLATADNAAVAMDAAAPRSALSDLTSRLLDQALEAIPGRSHPADGQLLAVARRDLLSAA